MPNAGTETCSIDTERGINGQTIPDDPVVGLVRAWIALLDRQDELVKSWQEAEHRLSLEARSLKIGLDVAARGCFQDARSMRTLMRQIKSADRKLTRDSGQIAALPSTSRAGALAKLEMALRMRQPSIDDEQAWELVNSVVTQMRERPSCADDVASCAKSGRR